ncbi:MAG: hypothetical protein GC168_01800 [Candidatus Hydrogenedens sp.]|nr:hypothetical protein [Candidatus Hydrogenedens sp.]
MYRSNLHGLGRMVLALLATATLGAASTASASSDELHFVGGYSALNLGWDSGWWPGGGTDAPGGSPLQVRINAIAAADAQANVDGGLNLDDSTLALAPGSGSWYYQFGSALSMQAAINLSLTIPNPLGNDFKLGPWVVDIPFTPGYDLLLNGDADFQGYLLDNPSTLSDATQDVSIYSLSLIEYLIGGLDLPDWVLDLIGLDAGASLSANIESDASLSCDSVALTAGPAFQSESSTFDVQASPPGYASNVDYNERFDWDLTLNAKPTLFIKILGQRWDLPILTIPWNVLNGVRDLAFNTEFVQLDVAPKPEGEGSTEGTPEGDGEIVTEGEGAPEGVVEGEDNIVFITGCPEPCTLSCSTDGISAGFETALLNLYASSVIGVNGLTADLDGDLIRDIDLAKLLDVALASPALSTHCCVREAYLFNFQTVLAAVNVGNPIRAELNDALLSQALTGLITLGTPGSYATFRSVTRALDLDIPSEALTTAAAPYVAAFGDLDLDGVCNASEYFGAQQNALGFIFAATDPAVRISGAQCPEACTSWTEGENTEGEEGETPSGYRLLVVPEGDGQGDVAVVPDKDYYAANATVNLLVFAAPGSEFAGWTGTNAGELVQIQDTNQYVLLMTGNKEVHPVFNALEIPEGEGTALEGEGEGVIAVDGEGGAEGADEPVSSADINGNYLIELNELLRIIQLFNAGEYFCDSASDDGFSVIELVPGASRPCAQHTSDYNPADWSIELTELLRVVQFFNLGGYTPCAESEDGFCVNSTR